MPGDNLPIVDLTKNNIDGKEAKYIQINHIVGKLTSSRKITEVHTKKPEFEFMFDLKTQISKTAIKPQLLSTDSSEKEHAPGGQKIIRDGYRTVFDKLSIT